MKKTHFISSWKSDLPASLVVYLVALPLCLGVAFASTDVSGISGVPNLFSGIIAGVVGGIVVGAVSGSRLGVSGPAAGLITIVAGAIATLGSFEAFLLAVFLAGVIQVIAGFLKAGVIGHYFPSSVIKGMLAAIGLTLILKEIPHLVGYDADPMGEMAFVQPDGHNTFSELLYAANNLSLGAVIISIISLVILLLFDRPFIKRIALFTYVPGALFVVVIGILLNIGLFDLQTGMVFKWKACGRTSHRIGISGFYRIFPVTGLFLFSEHRCLCHCIHPCNCRKFGKFAERRSN
jgi:MFS superfamily sulfate permease-like transporter